MRYEQPRFLMLLLCGNKRISCGLHTGLRAFDPVEEITRGLYLNDQHEARLLPVIPDRSSAWLFTLRLGVPPPSNGRTGAMPYIGVDFNQRSFTAYRLESDGSETFTTYQLYWVALDLVLPEP